MDYCNLSFRKHWKPLALCLLVYMIVGLGFPLHDMIIQKPIMSVTVEGFVGRWALYYLFAMVMRIIGMLPFCVPVLVLEYIGFYYALPIVTALFHDGAIWAMAILLQTRFLFLLIPSWIAIVLSWQQTKLLVRYRDIRYLRWEEPTKKYTWVWLIAALTVTLVEVGIAAVLK